MADLLRKGSDWLAKTLAKHCSEEVQYMRACSSVTVRAVRGKSEFETESQDGFLSTVESIDFMILVEELKLDQISIEPQSADQIIADGKVYEVTDIAGHPCWRYSDAFANRYRIHTKYAGPSPYGTTAT